MEAMQYRYEARVNVNAWWIRLYAWAWQANKHNADFCRLFWGLAVFLIPNLMVRGLLFPFWLLWKVGKLAAKLIWPGIKGGFNWTATQIDTAITWAMAKRKNRKPRRPKVTPISSQPDYPVVAGLPRRPWRSILPSLPKFNGERVLDAIGTGAAKVRVVGQDGWDLFHWPILILFYGAAALLGLAIALLFGFGFYYFVVTLPVLARGIWIGVSTASLWVAHGIWWLGPYLAAGVGGVIIAIIVLAGFIVVKNETQVFQWAGRKTARGTSSFFGAMRTGLWGVKRNTCPKIVLVEEDDE